ncbi:EAL domain-containing protein [Sphingomonas cavernae]|uniref:EAL domain-containing protein n=1 Tax=Sphingomonas cavernae TaxID=2320861 RepID=A0A418WMU1_9SPHN|nr:EAL domain-containing protein [Sphingomonas cavernae]RJF91321.1 EAL domain-containing protein [Sphingomonas cavernae]
MLKVYSCLAIEHDFRLVLLAGLICALAMTLTHLIVRRAAGVRGADRQRWLALSAASTGLGIWSTHFIAMIAYQPQLPTGYDVPLTLLSIAIAIIVSWLGWTLELRTKRRSLSPLPALVLAAGIGMMHFVGMQALEVQGRLDWDSAYVVASVAIGATLVYAALLARRRLRRTALPISTLVYTLAICGLHFTAMAAVTIMPDPRMTVPAGAIASGILAVMVGAGALILLAIGAMHIWLDYRLAMHRVAEQQRVEDFANAAVEGLAVVEQGRIVDANAAFLRLAGSSRSTIGTLGEVLPALADLRSLEQLLMTGQTREMTLVDGSGETIDVEITARPIMWRRKPHTVLAVSDIRARKEAERRIHHLAFHDPLTGIANRTLFNTQLKQAIATRAEEEKIAVLCFDLDRFKAVNDVYGHALGDQLLRHVATQIGEVAGADVIAARLGGDEFALMYRVTADNDPASLARRLLARLSQPVPIDLQTIRVSSSIGIAMIPADARNAAEALRHADLALYRAKADGRGGYRFFEPAMDAIARERATLEADLREAIEHEQLLIDYQPLVGIESGRVEGFEALVRWQHPTRGLIMPTDFVPVAEDSGLIVDLGEWVLRRACTDAARWNPPLRLSVNLSPAQFGYADVCETVARALADSGLPPQRLELEVTEGVFIHDAKRGIAILERIRATGVQIAMDDFGTGYSSLSYFRQFPFDKVKIDRSFIKDMLHNSHARSIVEAIISLGRGLNLQIVAEGVETAEQLAQLQGCSQVQGYYLSPPLPIGQFAGSVLVNPQTAVELPSLKA